MGVGEEAAKGETADGGIKWGDKRRGGIYHLGSGGEEPV